MKKIVITLSYGDYTCGVGGTDKAILTQVKILNDSGYSVISLSPCIEKTNTDYWDVLYDSKYIGVYSNDRLFYYLSSIKNAEFYCFIIHHLNNIDICKLIQVLEYLDIPILMYLHDYYTICPKNGLILESGLFCGEGFPNEDKCHDCKSFTDSKNLLGSYQRLLNTFKARITFILPSDAACNIWTKHYPEYIHQVRIIYHQNPNGAYIKNSDLIKDDEPIRIAFVGYQMPLKGWKEFKDAASRTIFNKCNIKFYQFGWGNEYVDGIMQVKVDFKKNMNAMIDILREKEIHAAVLWSLWPETYSYTYYEALAANCFIITNNFSGNICSQVDNRKNGIICNDLTELFSDEIKLRSLINSFRNSGFIAPNNLEDKREIVDLIPIKGISIIKRPPVTDKSLLISSKRKIIRKMKLLYKGLTEIL